ncbi:PadR family transcriptional regulator [Kribbella sp. VKM Ac-2527]|uniref:PadR family transcriptional regulator n=1 Tax=Kribbella caucasensis TaxID=2512215 RepID=A0A4R6KRL3_9ACTN|nr:PadR family transcriptional regulator [Kribbella sp. VKM Ac-2527]TDO54423.1 PadR family transcriptional regulator [Kribbella sp. VKM Ac-2527]
MATAELVLGLLHNGPAHGYDVKRGHDAWFPDSRPLAFGQVYTTLSRLERDGLVEVVDRGSEGGPERTVYALTPQGREHLAHWLAEPIQPALGAVDEMVRKVVATIRTGEDASAFLARQRSSHLRRIRELKAVESDSDSSSWLVRDYMALHLDADLRWLDNALDRITEQKETSR